MSLRLRLTLLYSIFIGGILVIFGAVVYLGVNFILINQVDILLADVADEVINATHVNEIGEISVVSPPQLGMNANAYVQLWSNDGEIIITSPSIGISSQPLDPLGLASEVTMYQDSQLNNAHLRVLTIPLMLEDRIVATLQVGASLNVIDATRQTFLNAMIITSMIVVFLAALGSWIVLGRALSPLETIADTVDQINRADDLSRRIPYRGNPNDEVGYLALSFNQTLERLESLFTSQQRFIADVSHELRTPLTVIKGNVDLMRRIKSTDDDILNGIDDEVGRLNRLVGGLLMLAQAESGKLALNFAPVELDLLLTEVFTEIRVLAGTKVRVHLNDIDQVIVRGDRDRLKQVLLNLIANAIQYTPTGGEVFLSLSRLADQGRLIVRDTGPGIPAKDLPHIFDRFYRAEKSRTRSKSSGFGLGLSIAKWIIEQHGGQIKVESKEGEGTTFVIWLNVLK
jgi:two-component system, OmpR family, sensor kinase